MKKENITFILLIISFIGIYFITGYWFYQDIRARNQVIRICTQDGKRNQECEKVIGGSR